MDSGSLFDRSRFDRRRQNADRFIALCGVVVAIIFVLVAVLVFTTVFYPEIVGRFFRSIVDGYQAKAALAFSPRGRG